MPRHRQQSLFDDTFDLLKITLVWVGPVLAVVLFVLLRFLLPLFLPGNAYCCHT